MTLVAVTPLHCRATATAKGRMTSPARQRQKANPGAQDKPDRHIIRGVVTKKTGDPHLRPCRSARRQRPHGTSAPLKSP
jgi:hypothetical protein